MVGRPIGYEAPLERLEELLVNGNRLGGHPLTVFHRISFPRMGPLAAHSLRHGQRTRRRRSGANLSTVSEDERDQEHGDRDRERSDEAHWRVAEEGAEAQDDGSKQKTEKSQEDTRTADR